MKNNDNIRFHIYEPETEKNTVGGFRENEKKHTKKVNAIVIMAVALFFLFWISMLLIVPYDQFSFNPAWVFEHIKSSFQELYKVLFGGYTTYSVIIVRYLAIIVCGAALAASGSALKGSFKNTLAGPSTMGVMSGGSIGAMVYIFLFMESTSSQVIEATRASELINENPSFMDTYGQAVFVLAGCFLGVITTMGVANIAGRGKVSRTAMILSGTVISSLSSNIMMIVQYYIILKDPDDERITYIQELMMGSFDRVNTFGQLAMMSVPIIICLVILIVISGRLNLLSLGEDEARSMGINVKMYSTLLIIIATVLTAFVVAFVGRIGFLGFMIPMVAQKFVGHDMKKLLPASMLMGAIMLMVVYDVAKALNLTGYLNMITTPIGAIVMFITLIRSRKGGQGDEALRPRGFAGMGMR